MTSLAARVRSTFDKALAKKELLFAPSTIEIIEDGGMKFQILFAPAFGFKPTLPSNAAAPPAPPPKPVKRFNPFFPPQADLLVGPVEDSDYQVVLNKFTVAKDHILVTTKAYEAAYAPLGVSRAQLEDHYKAFDPKFEDFHESAMASNFVMTRYVPGVIKGVESGEYAVRAVMPTVEFIYVVPRTHHRPHDIHVHSMGIAGLLVATSEEERTIIKKVGPMTILKESAVAKSDGKL
ncbi:hypothetical protein HDU93_008240 [Gonapodya sp. JEL0774]|nr:hypothetical protein HDU93_008240 [Gonapodya sp. JEL0774]